MRLRKSLKVVDKLPKREISWQHGVAWVLLAAFSKIYSDIISKEQQNEQHISKNCSVNPVHKPKPKQKPKPEIQEARTVFSMEDLSLNIE